MKPEEPVLSDEERLRLHEIAMSQLKLAYDLADQMRATADLILAQLEHITARLCGQPPNQFRPMPPRKEGAN